MNAFATCDRVETDCALTPVSSIANRVPRPMQMMQPLPLRQLRVIDKISPGLGIVPVRDNLGAPVACAGDVLVYDEDWLYRNELEEGIYCIEYQKTVSCLPRADFAERFAKGDATARLDISRDVVQVRRHPKNPVDWWLTQPLGSQGLRGSYFVCSDGPMDKYILVNRLLGPVIGIYRPAPIQKVAA